MHEKVPHEAVHLYGPKSYDEVVSRLRCTLPVMLRRHRAHDPRNPRGVEEKGRPLKTLSGGFAHDDLHPQAAGEFLRAFALQLGEFVGPRDDSLLVIATVGLWSCAQGVLGMGLLSNPA